MENENILDSPAGVAPALQCYQLSDGRWKEAKVLVPEEMALTIYINGRELVTILCTPAKLNCLVTGFLFSEGLISSTSEIVSMRVCEDESLADVCLSRSEIALSERRILTSGCGGGVSFTEEVITIESELTVSPSQILNLMNRLLKQAELYNLSGGIHTSALCNNDDILVIAEDIGRHNTLDKIQGECLFRKISTSGKILLTTGRLSSEMLRKAAQMQVPVIASLTSPTERAISIAHKAGITLIGYTRGKRLSLYSCSDRMKSETDGSPVKIQS
ncbi:formate dehydrogenase accessory sulfurtransferase FdhD [Chloroflexota bacterium]